jgi:outer membrane scaffolding protein for murein synthesis (MipA/OmpV family)
MFRHSLRTKVAARATWACIASLALLTPACAQELPAAPAKDLPLWEIGLAGGAASTPAYPGADDRSTRALVLPFVIYRGKVLRADGASVSARLFDSDRVELDIGFAASLPARSDDVAARKGMPDLNPLLEFGPRLKVHLAEPSPVTRVRLELPLRVPVALSSGLPRHGLVFEPRVVIETGDSTGKWRANASLGVMAGNARLNAYFYEVGPQYATAARPAYQAHGGPMMARLGLGLSRRLSADWRVFTSVRYDSLAHAANRDSPLFLRKSGVSAGAAFMWTARRSQARAWE